MKKLAYIFSIALFLFGCGTNNHILNVSYDPIDYPPQFFSPKDQRPVLYIDPVVDKREFAPELVNFGIKASTVRQFLTSSGLPSKKSERTEEKSTEQLAEIAQNQALMVMCLR